MTLSERLTRPWPIAAALISAAMLGTAHAFETFGKYPPCELCLHQREAYWIALAIGIVGAVAIRMRPDFARAIALVLGLVFAAGALLAAYHAGVEWKWWPGPSSCTGAGTKGVSATDMADLLAGVKVHAVRCDEAAWKMLGLSMAGWNALASAGFAAISLFVAISKGSKGG